MAPTTVKPSKPWSALIAVTTESGLPATGKVTVTYGSTTTTVTLVLGVAIVPVNGLKAGTYTLTSSYQGNATTEGSSANAQVVVKK
ncbi:Ig-like domain repeat protein [Nocardioides bigeumensis]|uniref:Ig-like domain repeat protein n=1 Tax=Nocardioides bigeumensis TaxID=433657 RepID=UPI0031D3EA01